MTLAGLKYYLENPKKLFSFLAERGVLNWMSDEAFLKKLYKINMGEKLNLKAPKTFNEKLQWLKLYNRKPEYTKMVDKYEAKNYVANLIGAEYIIPTLGVWEKFEDIDFDALPNQFVLKCTHDSGGLVICRDKSKLNFNSAKLKINKSLKRNFYKLGREWPYKNVKPRIIAEQYMEDNNGKNGLMDYKFYCFNGKPEFLYISNGLEDHSTAKISFVTLDWEFADFKRLDFRPFDSLPKKPSKFMEMLELCEILSKNQPFLRVDLYQINDKIYFSELTFSPCGGMMKFNPQEWDEKIGTWINLPEKSV